MTKLNQIYKCTICGNIVEMVHASMGELVCCGQKMNLMQENTTDAAQEKHVPVIEKTAQGLKIKVGSTTHPMEEKHFIEWIELLANNQVYRKQLKPGNSPEAEFCITATSFNARAYCNLHGLWQNT
ncbi:desulfoferrodoxin [bacterium]|jgi:superoxide reductase|nr:desulfoferrodoxin [bacterium]MBT3581930.1 desulfoferrodoxin [bacterium]MBT4551717.1 desulfoferrodoxin [bacterium]MBT7088689.1 desulfoferrodoxin [bacterium]